jgi:hypothetical protein
VAYDIVWHQVGYPLIDCNRLKVAYDIMWHQVGYPLIDCNRLLFISRDEISIVRRYEQMCRSIKYHRHIRITRKGRVEDCKLDKPSNQ